MKKILNVKSLHFKNGYSSILNVAGIASVLLLLPVSSAFSDDLQFSDDPMETKVQSAPPNIMFVLDNSGSMDWSMMTTESEGKFGGDEHVFLLSDNRDDALSGDEKIEWKSQWAGYNKLFFNPQFIYNPWPGWNTSDATAGTPDFKADLKTPRSNPIYTSPTLNLHDNYYSSLPTAPGIIVDDADSGYAEEEGTWSNSGSSPEWGVDSRYTNSNPGRATFTPDIPSAGAYKVYGWWNCYDGRNEQTLITLKVNGTEEASKRYNQRSTTGTCGQWVELFDGNSFTLPAGDQSVVSVIRDGSANGSTVADAIGFVPASESLDTVDIKNAHYYVVNDVDEDGPEAGEIYLVNFIWTDADSDSIVDDGEVKRKHYKAYPDGTGNQARIVYLEPVADADVPDAIQPKNYDEEGNFVDYKSDYVSLQNFANWFSFYRKRELAAKAAISLTINDLKKVYVGYYTLHSSGGTRQTVLPIKVVENQVIETTDSNSNRSSGWSDSGAPLQYNNDDAYYTTTNGAYGTFTPVQDAGEFNVYGWWPCYNYADQNAKVSIVHSGGTTVKYVNQMASDYGVRSYDDPDTAEDECFDSDGVGCCGDWVDLGTYTFPALDGTQDTIKIERHSASTGTTYINAVKFSETSGAYVEVDDTDELLEQLYGIDSDGGTPLRQSLQNVGRYYDQDDSNDGNLGTSPYLSEALGGACQQCFAIAMTDGFWNGDSPGVGDVDDAYSAPYYDDWDNTLADVAMYYYDNDLSDSLPDEMATNNYDKKKTQHMVTFSVSFGLDGTIDLEDMNNDGTKDDPGYVDDPYFLDSSTPMPTWPQPSGSNGTKIDDLFHAAVNGRGTFFAADDPESLVEDLKELFEDISSRAASGASVSVNGDQLSTDLVLYQSSYESGSWLGNVVAYPINPDTSEVLKGSDDIIWEAQEQLQLQNWDTERKLFTFDGTAGQPFRWSSLNWAQKEALDNESDMVEYLRGEEITGYRPRSAMLGDIVHSAPLLIDAENPETDGYDNDGDLSVDEEGEEGGTIYVGGNDGMVHAINAVNGHERFAYFPLRSFDYLSELGDVDYDHRFYVDSTPTFKRLEFLAGDQRHDMIDNDKDGCTDGATNPPDCSNENSDGDNENYSDGVDNDGDGDTDEKWERKTVTLLVGGLGKGGRGVYALDVTGAEGVNYDQSTPDEASIASSMALWEYPPVGAIGIEYTYAGDQRADGIDNDGDGCVDGVCPIDSVTGVTVINTYTGVALTEEDNGDNENYSDGFDNDGDGVTDEEGEKWIVNVNSFAGDQSQDNVDNDGDGTVDEADEDYGDGVDNDEDGTVDEAGELEEYAMDDDIGYTYGQPYIVRSYKTLYEGYSATSHPWVVIFGNGYESKNGHAVLYVLNALDGTLIRKIDTGVGPNNGLSTPTIIDVDNDDRVDFVYAGDLLGNMWKFDLTDSDPENWGVAFGTDVENPTDKTRIDYADEDSSGNHDVPAALFSAPNRPITSAPDVMYHCDLNGYMVIFGTGKFLGEDDRTDLSMQSIFGIWDYGINTDQYVGTWDSTNNTLSNLSGVKLLEQTEIDWRYYAAGSTYLRTLSDNEPNWYTECYDGVDNDSDSLTDELDECKPVSHPAYAIDGADNDYDDVVDEPDEAIGHAGWYFDLPYKIDASSDLIDNDGDGDIDETGEQKYAGERVIKDVIIREGVAIVISFIPNESPCSGGGDSIVHEMSACSGGRTETAVFDINGDGIIDDNDYIIVDGKKVAPTGRMYGGMLHTPVIAGDKDKPKETKFFSTSQGTVEIQIEKKEKTGVYYWMEH